MSEKISSNRDIRNFFQTNSKENTLKISQQTTKTKMSREPLFELQPSLDLEKSPSPPPKLENVTSSSNCQKTVKSDDDSDSIPELDTITEETKVPKKRKRKKLFGGQGAAKKKCKKEKPQNLDLGPNEFSDESDHEITIKKSVDDKVKNEVKKEEGDEGEKEDEDEEEYDVEQILDYKWCLATTQGLYLVKWQGWGAESNTWEPLAHLQDCCEKLKEFYTQRLAEREAAPSAKKRFLEVPADPRTNFERRSELADTICPPPCHSELEAFNARLKTHPVLEWKEKILNQTFDMVAKSKNPHEKKRQQLREQIMLKHVMAKKKEQQKRLKEWEREINEICVSTAKITVENQVDFEGPPRQMTFISEYKPAAGIVIPDDPPIGCECTGICSSSSKECCPENNGHLFPYTRYGKLRVQVGVPIYECNKRCLCADDCFNKVVQKGGKVKLCIYRTDNGCGWGVRTLENIKKGTFVVEYVGEVITSETAEERGQKYDAEGRTYLFDLDFNQGNDNPYTVDAAYYGNVSHFINHSCDANLAVFNVWINCMDPDLPRLALFAIRDIVKGEQLTFDYRQRPGADDSMESIQSGEEAGMECKCGSSNCRKVMFH